MSEELKMYTKYVDGKPYQYRYGEPWRATQLMVDGGYDTPEEAKEAWYRENMVWPVKCRECELFQYDGRLPIRGCCTVIPVMHDGTEYCSFGVRKKNESSRNTPV